MLKKLIAISLLANSLFTMNMAFADDHSCSADNRVSLQGDKICCCIKTSETTDGDVYKCDPTDPVVTTSADGRTVKSCPKDKTRISSSDNTCICSFNRKKK